MQTNYQFKAIDNQYIVFPDNLIRLLHESRIESSLIDKMHHYGQAVPLLVWEQPQKRYQLLAGYSSFTALTSLGIKKTICQILPFSTPPTLLYSLQILHGLDTSQASPILQAHLLQQAQQNLTDKEIFSLLSLMGHKPQRYKLDELVTLLQLSLSAIAALHQGILAPKIGRLLKLLCHKDQELLVQLIKAYRPGGSKQQKLVEMITELSLRDGKSVQELVEDWLLKDKETQEENRPQQLQGIMQSLSEMYWPEKNKMEKKFQKLVQGLQLPDCVTIAPSQSFEDESVEIRFRFANSEMLREKWESIRRIIQ